MEFLNIIELLLTITFIYTVTHIIFTMTGQEALVYLCALYIVCDIIFFKAPKLMDNLTKKNKKGDKK